MRKSSDSAVCHNSSGPLLLPTLSIVSLTVFVFSHKCSSCCVRQLVNDVKIAVTLLYAALLGYIQLNELFNASAFLACFFLFPFHSDMKLTVKEISSFKLCAILNPPS